MSPDFGPEPFGDSRLVQAQLAFHAGRAHLRTLPDTFEQGRTFGFMNVQPSTLEARIVAARHPGRLLAHVGKACSHGVTSVLQRIGYIVSGPLDLMVGDARTVLSICKRNMFVAKTAGDLRFVRIDDGSPRELVRAIQELQSTLGITPLPGWHLRGGEVAVLTLAIVDSHGAPVGVGSIQDIGNASGRGRAAMGLAICISPQHQKRGLGTFLNSRLLAGGLPEFGAACIWEVVDDPSGGSRRMNELCGLRLDDDSHFLFAERSR